MSLSNPGSVQARVASRSRLSPGPVAKALAVTLLAAPLVCNASDFETPPVLDASRIAGDIPLAGEHYTVSETVHTDGFMATFTINSDFGPFSASGPGMLASRLDEIRALAALEQLQEDEQFKSAAAETARDTAGGLRTMATHPRETLEGVPEGVGRFFNRTGRSVRTGLQKLDDVRQGRLPGVDPAAVSDLPGGSGPPAGAPSSSIAGSVARAGGTVAVNMLGFDEHRRRLAKKLAVDPYTTNPVLAAELDAVTWSAFAGGLGINLVTSMIPGGMIISASATLTDWVWDTPPGDLRVEIEQTLLAAGASREETDRFLRHTWYTLSMQAVLASSLNALDDVEGRAEILPLALSVGSEGQARFVVQTVEMLKRYHVEREPFSALLVEGTVIGKTPNGARVVMAPVDCLSWTARLDQFVSRFEAEAGSEQALHVSGLVTDRALAELTRRGWMVEDESALGPVDYPVR